MIKVQSYLTYKIQDVWKDAVVWLEPDPVNPGNAEGVYTMRTSTKVIQLGNNFKEARHAVQGLVRAERERIKIKENDNEKAHRIDGAGRMDARDDVND